MRKNRLFYILVLFVFMLFGFCVEVDAAQELTCVYEKGKGEMGIFDIDKVILVQDSKGVITIYKNEKDVGIDAKLKNGESSYWYVSSDEYNLFTGTEKNSVKLSKDKKSLTECPATKSTIGAKGKVEFYGGTLGKQKLVDNIKEVKIPLLSATSENEKTPELTCVYKQGDSSVQKVAITQNSSGTITMYKNVNDVSIDTRENYWERSTDEKIFDSSVKKNSSGHLIECPKRKITNTDFLANGEVTFYGDDGAGDELEISYNELKNIQEKQTGSQSDRLIYDSVANLGKSCSQLNDNDKWLTDHEGYTLSCLYQKNITNLGGSGSGCHIIQINLGTSGINVFDSESAFKIYGQNYRFNSDAITELEASPLAEGNCPKQLMVDRKFSKFSPMSVNTTISFSGSGKVYYHVGTEGNNLLTGAEAEHDFHFNISFIDLGNITCDDLFGTDGNLQKIIKTGINVVKIIIPIILLVLGVLDFAQAVFASNEDAIKKAQSKFIKRLIIAVLIFLIPTILKAILGIAHSVWPIIDADLCGLI